MYVRTYTFVCTGWNMYVRTHLFVQIGICMTVCTHLFVQVRICMYIDTLFLLYDWMCLCDSCHVTAVYYQNYSHIKLLQIFSI